MWPSCWDCGAILTVGSCAAAETVSAVAVEKGVTARVHVKLDTGMGRFGFLPQDVTEAAALLKSLPSMRVEGVFTHFANAADEALTRRQYQRFQEGAALLERAGIETGLRHVCASSAFLRYPEMQLDAVRLGSALLGQLSVPDPLGLEKIGWLETQVMELKDLPSGWKVGYAGAYRTRRPTRLALLPTGYTSGVGVTEESNALRLRDRVYPAAPHRAGTAAQQRSDGAGQRPALPCAGRGGRHPADAGRDGRALCRWGHGASGGAAQIRGQRRTAGIPIRTKKEPDFMSPAPFMRFFTGTGSCTSPRSRAAPRWSSPRRAAWRKPLPRGHQ